MILYRNILFEYVFYVFVSHISTCREAASEIGGDFMTRIQEIVYAIPEEIFKDEVFKKLVHTKIFSRLRCIGPECLSPDERDKITNQITEYCKVTPKEEELEEFSYAFSKRTMEIFKF